LQVVAGDIHVAAAEAHQVGIRDMRTHGHAPFMRRAKGLQYLRRAAGVKATGHIGAADDVQHADVVAHGPGAIAFAKITVDVYHESDPKGAGAESAGSSARRDGALSCPRTMLFPVLGLGQTTRGNTKQGRAEHDARNIDIVVTKRQVLCAFVVPHQQIAHAPRRPPWPDCRAWATRSSGAKPPN